VEQPSEHAKLTQRREEIIKALAAADRRPISQFLANLVEDAVAKRKPAERRSAA